MPRATLPGWTDAATRRLCGTGGFQGSPIQAAPLTKRPQLQAAGIVWHAAASDYASLLPMTATLHSGRVGVKQFASQAIEPIGGGGPGGGAWTAETAGRRGVRGARRAVLARRKLRPPNELNRGVSGNKLQNETRIV